MAADGRRPWLAAIRPSATDVAAFVVGVILLGASWAARNEAEAYAALLAAGGLLLVILALYNGITKSASLGPGGVSFERREQDASAELAEAAADDVEAIAGELDSDDDGPPSGTSEDPNVLGSLSYVAGSKAVRAILDELVSDGALHGCDVRLYLYDAALDALAPVFSSVPSVTTWPPGRGATGVAWSTGDYVVAEGDAVHDSTYGLTEVQASRYVHLAAVAAAPVYNAGGRVIAVLTASTTARDHSLRDGGIQFFQLNSASLLVSRVLVDLLKWDDDSP